MQLGINLNKCFQLHPSIKNKKEKNNKSVLLQFCQYRSLSTYTAKIKLVVKKHAWKVSIGATPQTPLNVSLTTGTLIRILIDI